ncbi:BlaI/MecI/CopY family transcriptional regulator [Nocardioides abyssi]|uniref:BlaI/MecI/CopY family transcriptional regulator n=1 Tax=Nocardioides abyssi TaxID=3058370 RepID=A0ABT8EVL4_9ACTN|nr:BlaI/MecI/CopY family transcriptional regulator [Nocardioides abyssi]MDN4161916.1 BlaI/MecI/CopY family transcriptional regulator [Nocardioides abyssi]
MRQLGQLEAAVMQRLWSWNRPVSVRDVLEDLVQERPLAYTTVMTVMDNLHSKGLVRRQKHGRAYLYAATSTREEHTAELLGQVLADSTDRSATLLRFVETLDPGEVAQLRTALSERAEEPS